MDNTLTFTNLRTLRDWLVSLDREDIDATPDDFDWALVEIIETVHGKYFHIETRSV